MCPKSLRDSKTVHEFVFELNQKLGIQSSSLHSIVLLTPIGTGKFWWKKEEKYIGVFAKFCIMNNICTVSQDLEFPLLTQKKPPACAD